MLPVQVISGDDRSLAVQLTKNGSTFSIDAGATVQAVFRSPNGSAVSPIVTCSSGATGASWGTALVVVEFTEAETDLITYEGPMSIEIQVDDGGKSTWIADNFVAIADIID